MWGFTTPYRWLTSTLAENITIRMQIICHDNQQAFFVLLRFLNTKIAQGTSFDRQFHNAAVL